MTNLPLSFSYAWSGIRYMLKSQVNARIHILALLLAISAGLVLHISHAEWIWISVVSGLVLAAEAFNTAIEKLVDLVSPERKPEAGKIKDLSAGAVLITALTALVTGLIILLPKILQMLKA